MEEKEVKVQKFLTEGIELPGKSEDSVIELLHLFAKHFNNSISEIKDSVDVKCRWENKHDFSTGIPTFTSDIWFEYTATNSEGLEKKWRYRWFKFQWTVDLSGRMEWKGIYEDMFYGLFSGCWRYTGERDLRNVVRGDVKPSVESFTGRGVYHPFSKIKDAMKHYRMTWFERAQEDFYNDIQKGIQDQFDREHEIIMQREPVMWLPLKDHR